MPELEEKAVNYRSDDIALATTTETLVISSGPVKVQRATCLVHIRAWAVLTTGAATTTVTPRIRRGTAVTGTAVGQANTENVKAAAGSSEPFVVEAIEQRENVDTVEYSLTLQQVSATGNGNIEAAAIEVEILGG